MAQHPFSTLESFQGQGPSGLEVPEFGAGVVVLGVPPTSHSSSVCLSLIERKDGALE